MLSYPLLIHAPSCNVNIPNAVAHGAHKKLMGSRREVEPTLLHNIDPKGDRPRIQDVSANNSCWCLVSKLHALYSFQTKTCEKKAVKLHTRFSFLESMSNLLQLLAHQPKPTNEGCTSQKLGKVFGDRKDPDAEPELDPVSESDSDPSVNFSMGKKHRKGGTARVCPPPERLDGKHHGTMSMSTMLIMSPLSLMYFEACVYCSFKMSLKFYHLQSITLCTRKIILTAPVQSSHLHISTCHFLASCVTRKLKDTKNMSHLDWNPRSFFCPLTW